MRILLTHDDGIHATGIMAMKRKLDQIGEVFMVAPERPRSAAGHAITLHKPLRCNKISLPDNQIGYATSGNPTDCVTLGVEIVMENRCDLIVSGINHGPNLGWDVTYSGTVAAALEGATLNIPSIAVSLDTYSHVNQNDFDPAANFILSLIEIVVKKGLTHHTLLNVNVPNLPPGEIKGAKTTFQGTREYIERVAVCKDPDGKPYYWQGGKLKPDTPSEGSDVHAVQGGFISVTPIQLDMTDYDSLYVMKSWGVDSI